jgi:hypothetical protein
MSDVEVWKMEEFKRGDYNIWPFEADYIELYRSTRLEIFLDKKWDTLHKYTERGTEHDNVLRLGYLIGFDGVMGKDKDQEERKKRMWKETRLPDTIGLDEKYKLTDEEKEKAYELFLERTKTDPVADPIETEGTHGVHFWMKERAVENTNYGGSLKLRVQIPTDTDKLWIKQGDAKTQKQSVHNRREMKQFYTKKELRENLFQANFADDVPLEWITGVHHTGKLGEGTWMDLDEFLIKYRKYKIFQLEDLVSEIKLEDDIEQQLNFLITMKDELRKLQYYLRNINNEFDSLAEYPNKFNPFNSGKHHMIYLDNLEDFLLDTRRFLMGEEKKGPGYIQLYNEIVEYLEEELDLQNRRYETVWNEGFNEEKFLKNKNNHYETAKISAFLKNLENLQQKFEEIIQKCLSLAEEEKKRRESETGENVFDEEKFESKLDKQLTEEILALPDLQQMPKKIDKKIEEIEELKSVYQDENETFGENYVKNDHLNGVILNRI